MSCEWFEVRLDELLDDRRDPVDDAEIRAHARECSRCRATLAAQRQWLTLLPQALAAEGCESNGFAAGPAEERVARGRRPTAAVWRRWTAVLSSLAVVAGLVLVISLEGGWQESREERVARDPAPAGDARGSWRAVPGTLQWARSAAGPRRGAGRPLASSPAASSSGAPGEGTVAEGAQVALATRVAGAVQGGQRVEELPLRQLVNQWSDSWSGLEGTRFTGVGELAEGMRPIATSVGGLMEVLRQRWQSPRGERLESAPDTSWVADRVWVV